MERGVYEQELKEMQSDLKNLQNVVYRKHIPVVLAFEGNDAAGKGGSIKRVTRALDPRGYTVIPVGAPRRTSGAGITCGGFGESSPKRGIYPYLTAHGTAGCWWSG
jgi:polyphosphate kinase 2 (PPK2 family)